MVYQKKILKNVIILLQQIDNSNIIILKQDCDWIKNIIADTIIPIDERKSIEDMITKYGFKPNDSLLIDFYRLNQLAESKNTVKERFFKEKFFDISNDKINDTVNQISNTFMTQEKIKIMQPFKVRIHLFRNKIVFKSILYGTLFYLHKNLITRVSKNVF